MRKSLPVVAFLCCCLSLRGQSVDICPGENLFPNPSFEIYHLQCPDNYSGIITGSCENWYHAGGSPDYYNCDFWGGANSGLTTIGGLPSDGNGFVGIWSLPTNLYCNGKLQSEPIRATLVDTLIPNRSYTVSFDVRIDQSGNPSDSTGNPCVDFGIIFYKGNIPNLFDGCGCFTKMPQIRISNDDIPYKKYKKFTFTYIPNDYYTKAIIGPMCSPNMGVGDCATPLDNFGPFSSYINLDNLSLTDAPCVFVSDTTICQFSCLDSMIISRLDSNLRWELSNNYNATLSGDKLINKTICFEEPGAYTLKIMDDHMGEFILPDLIHIKPAPEADLGNDTILCLGEALTLKGGNPSFQYLWNDGTTFNELKIDEAGTYSVQKGSGDCSTTDSVQIDYIDCAACLEFPNVFTPNGDGVNDQFYPVLNCADRIRIIK